MSIEQAVPQQFRHRFLFSLLLVAIVVFGVAQALLRASSDLNGDEPYTANVINMPINEMFDALDEDNFLPLHYVMIWFWRGVFGESELALRSLSIVCFALTIAMAGLIGYRFFNPTAGLVAATLVSASSFTGLENGVTARPYAMLYLEVALGLYLFLAITAWTRGSRRSTATLIILAVLMATLNILGVLTHPTYVFFVAGCVLASVFVSRRAVVLVTAIAIVSAGMYLGLWGSILTSGVGTTATTNWIPSPSADTLFWATIGILGQTKTMVVVGSVLLFGVIRRDVVRGLIAEKRIYGLIVMLLAVHAAPFIVSYWRPIFVSGRTTTLALPILAVLSGYIISRLAPRWPVALLVILALVAGAMFSVYQANSLPPENPTRSSLQQVNELATCGDQFIAGGISLSELTYYLRVLGLSDCYPVKTFPLTTSQHPGWMDIPSLMANTDALRREAADMVSLMAEHPDTRIWLFYPTLDYGGAKGYGSEVTAILKTALENAFVLDKTYDLQGSFFAAVDEYHVPGDSQG